MRRCGWASETFEPGGKVAPVSRMHGVAESCLYARRKRFAGDVAAEPAMAERPLLTPVMIDAGYPALAPARLLRRRRQSVDPVRNDADEPILKAHVEVVRAFELDIFR